MQSQLQTAPFPGRKMVARGDLAPYMLLAADRPELHKSSPAHNRGLVDTLCLVDVVGATIAFDGASPLGAAAGIVRAVAIDDVVLNQGLLGPAVEREVRVGVDAAPSAVVFNRLCSAGIPPLAAT